MPLDGVSRGTMAIMSTNCANCQEAISKGGRSTPLSFVLIGIVAVARTGRLTFASLPLSSGGGSHVASSKGSSASCKRMQNLSMCCFAPTSRLPVRRRSSSFSRAITAINRNQRTIVCTLTTNCRLQDCRPNVRESRVNHIIQEASQLCSTSSLSAKGPLLFGRQRARELEFSFKRPTTTTTTLSQELRTLSERKSTRSPGLELGPVPLLAINRKSDTSRQAMLSQLHELSKQPTLAMLSSIYTRFMSTVRQVGVGSGGSGIPIESEQEKLLANSKGNKRIKINACGKLYTELSQSRPSLYGSAPRDVGINFEVHYYDSLELLDPPLSHSTPPTVCLLHGAPGHYKDYASLINYLTIRGIRVVAPNFPDYSATFEHSFRHSPKERLEFLLEFFKAINLSHIDMLIGHSSAVYTMFELLNHTLLPDDENRNSQVAETRKQAHVPLPRVKSMGLFSTPSHELPQNLAVTPFRLFTLRLFDYPILRPLILALIHTFVRVQGIQNRVDRGKIENLLIAASAMGYSQHERMAQHLKLLRQHRVPTFLVFGTNDKLIPMPSFNKLKRELGIEDEKQVKFYKADGSVAREVLEPSDRLVSVCQFESGGHYTFQRYAAQVNEDTYRFLTSRVLSVAHPQHSTSTDAINGGQQPSIGATERETTKL